MPEAFYEDMGRKARWFHELHGTTDRDTIHRLRDEAFAHLTVMGTARVDRLDPGGSISTAAELLGAEGKATVRKVKLPGHVTGVFVTSPVEIRSEEEELAATLKQRPRRGAQATLDPVTARMFRYDEDREAWTLVDASGWSPAGKYIWGRVDRPGVYAAVALPADKEELRHVAFEALARRTVRDAVATGHFAKAADFSDRAAVRSYFVDAGMVDEDRTQDRKDLEAALKAHRRLIRDLGPSLVLQPLGGNPQWLVLEGLVALKLTDVMRHINIDIVVPFWPLLARVANKVGPWLTLGPVNINGRVKSLAIHPTNSDVLWAGSANGGVWKTTNAGAFWTTNWKFEDSLAIGAVAVAPSNGDVVYAGTGEDTPGYNPSYGGVGLFKSTDGGDRWSLLASAAEVGGYCNKIVVHPTNSRKVYVASESGVYRADLGRAAVTIGGRPSITWKRVLSGRATDLVMQHDHPKVLLAGLHNNGVYKTVDGGDT